MRAPLGTAIFFISQVLALLSGVTVDEKVIYYLEMTSNQLAFVQNFVEDLLDLRQMRDGVFSLVKEVFNPNEVLDTILNLFKPQAEAKGVSLLIKYVDRLRTAS